MVGHVVIVDSDRMWAVLVVAEHYDDPQMKPQLEAPTHDMVAVLEWLSALGVPWSQVYVHLSATPERFGRLGAELAGLDLRLAVPGDPPDGAGNGASRASVIDVRRVDHAAIERTIVELNDVDGETILMFFMGHGLFFSGKTGEPPDHLFLCRDFTPPANTKNVAMSSVIEKVQCLGFPNAFVFYDACSKVESSSGEAPNVTPERLANPRGEPRPENGVFAVYASQDYIEAIEQPDDTGTPRSVFLKPLLNELHPARVDPFFVNLDASGNLSVDVAGIVEYPVKIAVADAVPQQEPRMERKGRFRAGGRVSVYHMTSDVDSEAFDTLKSVLEEWGWESTAGQVHTAFEYRGHVTQARTLYFLADAFVDLAMAVRCVSAGSPTTPALLETLHSAAADLAGCAGSTLALIPVDLRTRQLNASREYLAKQVEAAAAQLDGPQADLARRAEFAAKRIRKGAFGLRRDLEYAYALAAWRVLDSLSLGPVAPTVDRLRLWAVLSDALHLAEKLNPEDAIAALPERHLQLEPTQWWRPDASFPAEDERFRAELAAIASVLADTKRDVGDRLAALKHGHNKLAAMIDGDIVNSMRWHLRAGRQSRTR